MTALNGASFLGMIRVDGPPEWASGEGRYVLEADYKTIESALRELVRLRDAVESGDFKFNQQPYASECAAAWEAARAALDAGAAK